MLTPHFITLYNCICVFIIGGCTAYKTIPQSMSTNKINSVVGGLSTAILKFKIMSKTNTTMGFTKYKWYHRKSNMEVVPSLVVWLLVGTWYINVNRVTRPEGRSWHKGEHFATTSQSKKQRIGSCFLNYQCLVILKLNEWSDNPLYHYISASLQQSLVI